MQSQTTYTINIYRTWKRTLTILILIFIALVPNYAQTNQAIIESYTTDDGLPFNTIWRIFQDSRGFLWIGTINGLSRYDGRTFKNYFHDPYDSLSLSNAWIQAICEDHEGNIWIGTNKQGLNRLNFHEDTFTRFLHDTGDSTSISSHNVTLLAVDSSNFLWIGTDGGLDKMDLETLEIKRYRYDSIHEGSINGNYINVVLTDAKGIPWFGTNRGLFQYIKETDSFVQHSDMNVTYLVEDRNNNLWVGTYGGAIYKHNKDLNSFEPLALHDKLYIIKRIVFDSKNNLWVATLTGIFRYSFTSEEWIHFSHDPDDPGTISQPPCNDVYVDSNGVVWIGSFGGLNKILTYDPEGIVKFQQFRYEDAHPNKSLLNFLRSIYIDPYGIIWCGTNVGLMRYDRKNNSFRIIEGVIGEKEVASLLGDEDDILWVGTNSGLYKLNVVTEEIRKYYYHNGDSTGPDGVYIFSLINDKNGNLFIGSGAGFSVLEKDQKDLELPKFVNVRIAGPDEAKPGFWGPGSIYCLLEDSKGNIWLGTEQKGLLKMVTSYDADSFRYKQYLNEPGNIQSISYNTLHYLEEDSQGFIWIGTQATGLDRLDPETDEIIHFRARDGLSDDMVCALYVDETDRLWISTGAGLTTLDTKLDYTSAQNFHPEIFTNYNVKNGLQNAFTVNAIHASSNGELLLGGQNGFNAFYPKDINPSKFQPPIEITDFKLFNKSVFEGPGKNVSIKVPLSQQKKVDLAYNQDFFSFEFAALDYAAPDQIQYAYQMEGFDKDWVYIENRNEVSFTGLDPGNYTFRVKSTNSEGIWTDNETAVAVNITPPWWQTLGFKISAALLILFSIVATFRFRTNALRRRKRELETEVENRTRDLKDAQAQLIHSEKMASLGQLTAGVAHEINNPVSFTRTSSFALDKDLNDITSLINKYREFHRKSKLDISEIQEFEKSIDYDTLLKAIKQEISDIKEGTRRTSEIVKGLREFSHEDHVEMESADIHAGLDSTLNLLNNRLNDDVKLIKNYDPSIDKITCHIGQLNQVFMNLLTNALDAMDDKGKIEITTRAESNSILISIKDDGSGISKEIRDKIFDPFFTTKGVGKGTGLGLSISHGIIENHGGKIEVKSEEGKGCEFIIKLHLHK